MSALRQVLGGLLAVVLVGGAVLASTLMAFAEFGGLAPVPTSATATFTSQPTATALPTQPASTATATRPLATRTVPPPPTETAGPSETATSPPTATSLPPTATVAPSSPTVPPATPTPQPTRCVPSPPLGWTNYVVQRGDTLYELSLRFRVSQAQLQQVNCLANPSDIEAGQHIYAPPIATQPPPTPFATNPPAETATIPADIPTITSMPVPSATPACGPQEFYDPFLNRCRLPDPTGTPPG